MAPVSEQGIRKEEGPADRSAGPSRCTVGLAIPSPTGSPVEVRFTKLCLRPPGLRRPREEGSPVLSIPCTKREHGVEAAARSGGV